MIVVADTSPINYLILIGHIDILSLLYGRIFIPHAVLDELLAEEAPSSVRVWAQNPPRWLELLSPSKTVGVLPHDLDAGEAEAIVLAEELRSDWLLIDEAAGREEAIRRGLRTIGTLGILREAHRAKMLDLRDSLRQLKAAGFYVSDALLVQLLASVE